MSNSNRHLDYQYCWCLFLSLVSFYISFLHFIWCVFFCSVHYVRILNVLSICDWHSLARLNTDSIFGINVMNKRCCNRYINKRTYTHTHTLNQIKSNVTKLKRAVWVWSEGNTTNETSHNTQQNIVGISNDRIERNRRKNEKKNRFTIVMANKINIRLYLVNCQ